MQLRSFSRSSVGKNSRLVAFFALAILSITAISGSHSLIPPVHANSQNHVVRVTRSGTPDHVATKAGAEPLNNYAEVVWQTSDNYSVTSSAEGGGTPDCVNSGDSPCFSLQLTVYWCTSGCATSGGYQFVFFINHGQPIIACATNSDTCSGSNECTITGYPSDGFVNDEFSVVFDDSTAYYMGVYNSGSGLSTCDPITVNISDLVSWEVSTGVGEQTANGSYNTCAVWGTGATYEVWSINGFAPSYATGMTSTSTTPNTCTTSGDTDYNGGSALWDTDTTWSTTGECSNLASFSFTDNLATDFMYTVSNA